MRIRLVVLLILLATTGLGSADECHLVFSVRQWEGEFESTDVPGGVRTTPYTSAIYSVRDDGTELRRLVAIDNAVCAAPVFSPDATWLYFQSNATGQTHLYRCRPDGTGQHPLTSATRPGQPWKSVYGLQMTASGDLLATTYNGNSGCVALLAPDASEIRLVAPQLGYLYMSAMSPQGDAVVVSGPASNYCLWLLELTDALRTGISRLTGPSVDLAPQHPQSFAPQFTPDGKTVVYFRRDGDLYRVNRDGTGHKRLTEGNRYVEFRLSPKDHHGSTDGPHLAPDGRRIAFIALRNQLPQVCTIDIDGANFRQLTFLKTACGRARWSPDGKQIAFVSFVDRYPQLFVVRAEGGAPRQLTHIAGAVDFLNWKPPR